MKKYMCIIIVLIIFISGLVLGCSNKNENDYQTTNYNYIDSSYNIESIPKTINLSTGETIMLNLKSNPSTGYKWQIDINDETILELAERSYEPGYDVNLPPEEIPIGTGGNDIFSFEALKKGKTKITLKYARPWSEKDVAKKITISIVVE